MNTIFVQIASYRDPELLPTIRDLIDKARYPKNLRFGICWQHSDEDEWDNLDEYKNDSRFRILDYKWNDSNGLCWARSKIQKLWNREKYTLQLDSHHRFAKHWDVKLIKMMKMVDSEKPIISSYACPYNPETNKKISDNPYKMVANRFTPSGTILFFPHPIENYKELKKPIPARFVSGHFFFTYGIHCEEYKYDPNLYFAGDEISLSIRSYTLGYDLYHPHENVIWHEYTREGRTKHWDDFNHTNKKEKKIESTFYELDDISKKRLRKMLKEEDNDSDIGIYGLGSVRTHSDYEKYAGICFSEKKLHPDTKAGLDPPVNADNDDWKINYPLNYNLNINWNQYANDIKSQVSCNCEFDFIYIGIESENGDVLRRDDLTDSSYLNCSNTCLNVSFESDKKPYKYVIWPHSKQKGWLNRIDVLI